MNLPVGSIILWTSGTIPDGWQVCDGTNGTPNLINKFVRGASQDSQVGNSDGEAAHGHTNTDLDSAGSHGHSGVTHSTTTSATTKILVFDQITAAKSHTHGSVYRALDTYAAHVHTVGDTDDTNNLPPYKDYIFIMRML